MNPPSNQKTPKLESLNDIEKYLKTLRTEIHSGHISTKDIDFIPIFQTIQHIVDKENLRTIISEFENTSELFQRKIGEIRAYISSIGGSENFEKSVKIQKEESLNDLFQALYQPPFSLEDINLDVLVRNFKLLSNRKNIFTEIVFSDHIEVSKNELKHQFNGYIDEVNFEEELEEFAKFLVPKLPISLKKLLDTATNNDIRYSYFVYCLYLIQRKTIEFDKHTNNFLKFRKKAKK